MRFFDGVITWLQDKTNEMKVDIKRSEQERAEREKRIHQKQQETFRIREETAAIRQETAAIRQETAAIKLDTNETNKRIQRKQEEITVIKQETAASKARYADLAVKHREIMLTRDKNLRTSRAQCEQKIAEEAKLGSISPKSLQELEEIKAEQVNIRPELEQAINDWKEVMATGEFIPQPISATSFLGADPAVGIHVPTTDEEKTIWKEHSAESFEC